jgi:hypothetical protein
MPHLRGGVDDGAALLHRQEPARHRLGGEESGAHVEVHDGVEVQDRDLGERLRPVHPRVVEEHIVGVGIRHDLREAVEIGHVARDRVGRAAPLADRLRAGLDLVLRARDERHMRSGLRKRRCGGETDAASCARDECAFAVQTK